MPWILGACLLGAIAAVMQHYQMPFASWLNILAIGIVVCRLVYWFTKTFSSAGGSSARTEFDCSFGGDGDGGGGSDSSGCDSD